MLFICGTTLCLREGHGRRLESNFDKARALLKEAGYRRNAGRPDAVEPIRSGRPTSLPARQAADGAGRLQGRHAAHDLAEHRHPRRQQEPARKRGGWNAYLVSPSAMGLVNPVSNHPSELFLRESAERLALRSGDGEAARPTCPRDRSGEAEGNRRSRAASSTCRMDALCPPRRMAPGSRRTRTVLRASYSRPPYSGTSRRSGLPIDESDPQRCFFARLA